MNAPKTETAPAWDGWLRLFVIGYFLGGVVGLWGLWLLESLTPGHVSPDGAVWLCAVVMPAICLTVSAWRHRRGRYELLQNPPTEGGHGVPVWLALGVFGAWAGCYYTSGFFVSEQPMATLFTAVDHAIPLIPESTFIYVTVQWFVVLAIALGGHALPWRRVAGAYATNVVVCTLCFLAFPVTFHHTSVPITDLSTWTLSVLRAGDIANNCFPSSHCSMALLSAFLLYRADRFWGHLGLLSALAIGFTTITTKQHYAADVVAGFALAGVSYVLWWRAPQPVALETRREEA